VKQTNHTVMKSITSALHPSSLIQI